MANDPLVSQKRTAQQAGLDSSLTPNSAAKKRTTRTVHHDLKHGQEVEADSWFACQDHEVMRQMLDRSLAIALDKVGFEYTDPLAITSFRNRVEEYMAHFLSSVRASMLNSRRRQPVPHDFVLALQAHNLTLSSLLPHLEPKVVDPETSRHPILNSKRHIMPPLELERPEAQSHLDDPAQTSLLNMILNGRAEEKRPKIIPSSFPPLPSRHTYKAVSVFPPRESDPARVREKATDEGRLGEEALRRFTAKTAEIRTARDKGGEGARKRAGREPSFIQQAEDMFHSVMDSLPAADAGLGIGAPEGMREGGAGQNGLPELLTGPVNAESRYWRKVPRRLAEKT